MAKQNLWVKHLDTDEVTFINNIHTDLLHSDSSRRVFRGILTKLAETIEQYTADHLKLQALHAGGVQSWEWYDDSLEALRSEDKEAEEA